MANDGEGGVGTLRLAELGSFWCLAESKRPAFARFSFSRSVVAHGIEVAIGHAGGQHR